MGSACRFPIHSFRVEGSVRPRLSPSEQAMFRSQGGPLSSVLFTCFPKSPLSRIDSSAFRVLLLRRLWLPLSLLPLASAGAAVSLMSLATTEQVAQRQVLGRRVFALESAEARVCREAGARVTTNVMVRDLDLLPMNHVVARRLEVVADGLPTRHVPRFLQTSARLAWMWRWCTILACASAPAYHPRSHFLGFRVLPP